MTLLWHPQQNLKAQNSKWVNTDIFLNKILDSQYVLENFLEYILVSSFETCGL